MVIYNKECVIRFNLNLIYYICISGFLLIQDAQRAGTRLLQQHL